MRSTGERRRGALDENGLCRRSRKLCAALFKVVQLPLGSRETEVAVLIVFFCGEIIIMKEMREHNVLLNFLLVRFFLVAAAPPLCLALEV